MAQVRETPTHVKVVQPGEGDTRVLRPGIGVQFKIDGEDVAGAISIVENPFDVGALVPPHVHQVNRSLYISLKSRSAVLRRLGCRRSVRIT